MHLSHQAPGRRTQGTVKDLDTGRVVSDSTTKGSGH